MAKLNRVGVFFLAKLQASIMVVVGLIAGILYAFGGLLIDLSTTGLNRGTALAMGALIGMPAIFAVLGFLAGTLGAVLYNVAGRYFGRIEVDIEQGQ